MSGPKVDQAELERMRKAELERQRLERLRKIRVATDQYNQSLQEIRREANSIQVEKDIELQAISEIPELEQTTERIRRCKGDALTRIRELMRIPLPPEPEDIEKLASDITKLGKQIMHEYSSNIAPEWKRVTDYQDSLDIQKQYNDFTRLLQEGQQTETLAVVDFSFAERLLKENDSLDMHVRETARRVLKALSELLSDESVAGNDRRTLMEFISRFLAVKECSTEELESVICEFQAVKVGICQRRNEFEALYQEYLAEYVVYLEELNQMRKTPVAIYPKDRSMFQTAGELEAELATVRGVSRRTNEQNYIREQLDAIMEQFGYNLCEDIVLSANQTANHYLCRAKEGENAIHISISDSKQIMMEIVSIESRQQETEAKISAIAVGSEGLTWEEKRSQVEAQGQFCTIHPRIVEECRKRGILLNPKAHQKPDLIFAKKMVRLVSEDELDATLSGEEEVINRPYVERRSGNQRRVRLQEAR